MADFEERPYANPNHPGNNIRANVKCVGCGIKGATTAWGPWCFDCNVERIDRINESFKKLLNE